MEQKVKIVQINTGGIAYLSPLTGSRGWYWGTFWFACTADVPGPAPFSAVSERKLGAAKLVSVPAGTAGNTETAEIISAHTAAVRAAAFRGLFLIVIFCLTLPFSGFYMSQYT